MQYKRFFDARAFLEKKSYFLFGPRSVGKTSLLDAQLGDSKKIDLLNPAVLSRYASRPESLLEIDLGPNASVVIDEIQKLPALLDAVQIAIQKYHAKFVMTGSSARKLKRQGVNLLGGRAWQASLHPLSFSEISDFDLLRYLRRGGLPHIYQSNAYQEELNAYTALYLREEIIQEAATRDVPAFSRFLETMGALSGGELVVDAVASDADVKASTVRNYLSILSDTLLTFEVMAFQKGAKRKAVSRSKIWLFDVAVANVLAHRTAIEPKSEAFGRAFEHFIVREVKTYLDYHRAQVPLNYWRTVDHKEVDLVLPGVFAAEIKGLERIPDRALQNLIAFQEERAVPRYFVISCEPEPRRVGAIEIVPWEHFLRRLWANEFKSAIV